MFTVIEARALRPVWDGNLIQVPRSAPETGEDILKNDDSNKPLGRNLSHLHLHEADTEGKLGHSSAELCILDPIVGWITPLELQICHVLQYSVNIASVWLARKREKNDRTEGNELPGPFQSSFQPSLGSEMALVILWLSLNPFFFVLSTKLLCTLFLFSCHYQPMQLHQLSFCWVPERNYCYAKCIYCTANTRCQPVGSL